MILDKTPTIWIGTDWCTNTTERN